VTESSRGGADGGRGWSANRPVQVREARTGFRTRTVRSYLLPTRVARLAEQQVGDLVHDRGKVAILEGDDVDQVALHRDAEPLDDCGAGGRQGYRGSRICGW
jgi:hypothetical protein